MTRLADAEQRERARPGVLTTNASLSSRSCEPSRRQQSRCNLAPASVRTACSTTAPAASARESATRARRGVRLGHRSLVRSRPHWSPAANDATCRQLPHGARCRRCSSPRRGRRHHALRLDAAMKRRTSSRSLVRQPHDRHPPRPAQCGKAIRKRSAIVSFTALPLVDAPRGRETPKGYFRPDLEQTAADEGARSHAAARPACPLHRPSPIC